MLRGYADIVVRLYFAEYGRPPKLWICLLVHNRLKLLLEWQLSLRQANMHSIFLNVNHCILTIDVDFGFALF